MISSQTRDYLIDWEGVFGNVYACFRQLLMHCIRIKCYTRLGLFLTLPKQSKVESSS